MVLLLIIRDTNKIRKSKRGCLKGNSFSVNSEFLLCSSVQDGTVVRGNDELERNLVVVETVALRQGLPPDAISSLLDLALSLRAGRGIGFDSITNLVNKINTTSMYYCPNFFSSLHRWCDLFADFKVSDTCFSGASGSHCTMCVMAVCGENDH